MSVKINSLELENVKRIKAVKLEPSQNGLTIVGGKNGQGKTSVLDSIAWALGGDDFKPSKAQREGSMLPPNLKVTLSNGLVVERKGKNSSLKVTDPSGQKAGQTLLNSFIDKLALDLPKFMNMNNKEKGKTLLRIIGLEEEINAIELEEEQLYNQRTAIGKIADQKQKYADEMDFYPDVPKELISASDLIEQQQAILAKNGENQRKRMYADEIQRKLEYQRKMVAKIKEDLSEATLTLTELETDSLIANKDAMDLIDESTEELETNIKQIDEINTKIRANQSKNAAALEAVDYKNQYKAMTESIEDLRKKKFGLLENAKLPLEGLSVEAGELTYKGQKWDNMSSSEQLKVAVSIIKNIKPECGFVLVDKLEQMDLDTLKEFGEWIEVQGLQIIATRVSTGNECSVIIEDGYSIASENNVDTQQKKWEAGKF